MFRITSLFLACLAVPAFAALGTPTSRQLQTSTIAELAIATDSLSTLVAAATAADLVDTLNADGTLTVFAPTNEAFTALPAGLLDTLLTAGFKKHLAEILLYHVFADAAVLSTALEATQELTMANGEMVTVNVDAGVVTIVTTAGAISTVTAADVEGTNGVVHIIDGVLVPSSIGATVIDIDAMMYSTLMTVVTLAGLEETLMSAGPFTLFAPTNAAFAAAFASLPMETVAFLQSPEGVDVLANILKYHVVAGSVTSDMLMDGAMVATVQGEMVTFAVGDTVMVNDATVVKADMLAFNGVTHGIDTVLTVPEAEDMPSGGLALGASLSALFAMVLTVVAL
jgi:transforming growth factor-beta-induced protein